MSWFFYAVACAVFFGGQGLYIRYLHLKNIADSKIIFFSVFLFSLPILFIPTIGTHFAPLQKGFWLYATLAAGGNLAGFYSYIKAFEFTETSLAQPIFATSPIFVIPVGFFILGEKPSLRGGAAIFIIVVGCYILTSGKNLLEPFKKIKNNKGIRWAFLAVLIWSFVANIDKVALQKSSARIYPFIASLEITIMSIPFVFTRLKTITKKAIPYLVAVGGIDAGIFLTHMYALTLTKVSYLIAVKRSGLLIGVVGGILLFREKEPARRILASAVILAGNILLYLTG
ncbi:MAG: EamA family transporter [Elusimicrobia bacterium]|nr:EamA family transporter [Elusimicrobiota bacterium]